MIQVHSFRLPVHMQHSSAISIELEPCSSVGITSAEAIHYEMEQTSGACSAVPVDRVVCVQLYQFAIAYYCMLAVGD